MFVCEFINTIVHLNPLAIDNSFIIKYNLDFGFCPSKKPETDLIKTLVHDYKLEFVLAQEIVRFIVVKDLFFPGDSFRDGFPAFP